MSSCSIYDKSLRFSRFIYGVLVLTAYFLQNKWLVLLVSILTILGAVSMNFNIPYQLHRYSQKKKSAVPSEKDFGEVSFVSAATGILLMIGFLLLQFTDYASLAWIYILLVVAMIFLACLVGFCVATLIYVVLKNKFSHKQN